MSMALCDECSDLVDTDLYPEGWRMGKSGYEEAVCEPCCEKLHICGFEKNA